MDSRAHTFRDRRAAILPRAVRAGTLLLAIGLAACGGDHNDSGEPEPPNPTQSYTVSATAGAGGQIAPATRTVDAGATASFTLTPDSGYHIDAVGGCGGSLAGNTYTTAAVHADCTVTASFAADPVAVTHSVTGAAGAGGQIAPATQTVADRARATLTLTPDSGFHIASVAGCGGTLDGSVYTTGEVTADCTVTASFAADAVVRRYTVTGAAGAGGRIAPASQTVDEGARATLTVTPDSGYHIDVVSGCGGALSGSTYTTGAVAANCTVTASFALDAPAPAARKLNDTGIVYCARDGRNDGDNRIECSDPTALTPAAQDVMQGRDAQAALGTLTKIGASTPNAGTKPNGFDFTKIGKNGETLPADATFWYCVRDNVTGLIWENKTDDDDPNRPSDISNLDPGLHDKDWTYSWYDSDPDRSGNGGTAGTENGGVCGVSGHCDTEKLIADVNAIGWCGANDWRLPNLDELQGIADRGRQFGTRPETGMAIDPGYFAHTQYYQLNGYWSATPAVATDKAWAVNFADGSRDPALKRRAYAVRLVREPESTPR
ncbi:DUF1566 domain-containing protein [Solimonas flava]|uniref:DUF1566 domain-containing protein n=1 Tax=Solimonas flava TaxID=415849 RepID=UPI00040F61FC|nr:DUF1566 domain-containing protein [Solimonas flava]